MRSSWQIEAGHLVCRWSEVGQHLQYNPPWMQEASDVQGSYLPPLPDFASHSPFGGPLGSNAIPLTAIPNRSLDSNRGTTPRLADAVRVWSNRVLLCGLGVEFPSRAVKVFNRRGRKGLGKQHYGLDTVMPRVLPGAAKSNCPPMDRWRWPSAEGVDQ
jgi:hypothetical protein